MAQINMSHESTRSWSNTLQGAWQLRLTFMRVLKYLVDINFLHYKHLYIPCGWANINFFSILALTIRILSPTILVMLFWSQRWLHDDNLPSLSTWLPWPLCCFIQTRYKVQYSYLTFIYIYLKIFTNKASSNVQW